MRYTKIILPVGLAALVVMALGVGPTFAQSDFGASPLLAPTLIGNSMVGSHASEPFMLLTKGGHRGFRGGFWFGGNPGFRYGYFGGYPGYPLEYNTNPSTTCVWNGYKYDCYHFPSERLYVY